MREDDDDDDNNDDNEEEEVISDVSEDKTPVQAKEQFEC